jgi:O-acetyl-ADP-ribose deacetylase (regulator of RNase III)
MIEFKTGDIFTEKVDAIVNTVNCVGVMGRGIALQFKKRFPENFKAYATACKQDEVRPGRMFIFDSGLFVNPRFIINFPTKRHWRGKSRMEDIESGLADLVRVVQEKGIHSIALPPLGCGLGGLDWPEVKARIESVLAPLEDVQIVVFEPQGAPLAEKMVRNREVPKMTPGRAALVELIQHYLDGLLDPFVTLLEVHKLMYFMQEAGEELKLKYRKHHYGPYADNLRHVLNAIEGHLLSGYADGGDEPDKQLSLVPGAYKDAQKFLVDQKETQNHFQRVVELVDGFETPYGLELLSTVHWVITHEKIHLRQDVVSSVHQWSERKKRFSDRQIGVAINALSSKEWIPKLP